MKFKVGTRLISKFPPYKWWGRDCNGHGLCIFIRKGDRFKIINVQTLSNNGSQLFTIERISDHCLFDFHSRYISSYLDILPMEINTIGRKLLK